MNIRDIKSEIRLHSDTSIFHPNVDLIPDESWVQILQEFSFDYERYYSSFDITIQKIKYYPGLLATFYYRIARYCFLKDNEELALEFSSLGFFLSGLEIYYSATIGKGLKINHGIGTVIGARTFLGDNVLLHHNVTLGDKEGGRPTIEDNVVIYPGTVIVGNVNIGKFSVIGANSFVDKSCPPHSIIY